ncbi:putative tail sheath protein [Serratia phage vB_SmaM_Yaphecito]|uniref:Putative tail sheath protein n=1 Tax=Serratia phage vB_SmaM_Yaphecito TaxID=2777368 RepID=A0A7T3NBZ5_9CAUD|nr:putative tail sheath protein [Serratia phage vB_SmaM_Yaphecito]
MSEQITSSTPNIYYRGTRDTSYQRSTGAPTTLPLHRPLIPFFSRKGPTTPMWIDPNKFEDIFGSEAVDLNSPYATHSTPFVIEARKAGNQFLAMRVEPEDIPDPATLGLSVDWMKKDLPEYKRDEEGRYILDSNGQKQATGTTIPGILMSFHFGAIPVDKDSQQTMYGRREKTDGTLGDDTAGKSQLLPLVDWIARDKSSLGPNTALRIWAPTTQSRQAADSDLQARLKSFLYRFQMLVRENELSSPAILETLSQESSVLVSLGTDTIDRETGIVYDFAERIDERYNDSDPSTWLESPIDKPYLYQANVDMLLKEIQALESAANPAVSDNPDDLYEINLFGAQTVEGVPYHTVQIQPVSEGGTVLSENASFYMVGGGDGTLGNASFNKAVAKILGNLTSNTGINLSNMARYPFNAFWDSGYDLATKQLIPAIIGFRADTWISLCTQDISLPDNTNEEEESIALSLLTRVQQFPDSTDFATPAFRGQIVGQCGDYTGTTRKFRVPLNLDRFAAMCSYAGAANGVLKSENAIDDGANRIVQVVKNVTNLDKSWRVKRRQWASGLVYVEDYDTRSQFYAGQQSFYPEPGSVLKSSMTGLLVANINRFGFDAWRDLSGNGKLSDDQLLERTEKIVTDRGANAFDNRLRYIPHAQITDGDRERGYSWSLRVDFGANHMRTVLDMSSVAYTAEELANG